MTLLEFFRSFYPIDDESFSLLTANFKRKTFSKGEMMVNPGDIQTELYFVVSGVQMSFMDTDRKEHVIAFTYPPNLCAIPESFMFQRPAPYALKSLTESEVNFITYAELNFIFDQSRSVERMFRKMTESVLVGTIARNMELHMLTIEERFKVFAQRSPHLLQLIPHKYIASYLGIDATNFSKLYNSIKI